MYALLFLKAWGPCPRQGALLRSRCGVGSRGGTGSRFRCSMGLRSRCCTGSRYSTGSYPRVAGCLLPRPPLGCVLRVCAPCASSSCPVLLRNSVCGTGPPGDPTSPVTSTHSHIPQCGAQGPLCGFGGTQFSHDTGSTNGPHHCLAGWWLLGLSPVNLWFLLQIISLLWRGAQNLTAPWSHHIFTMNFTSLGVTACRLALYCMSRGDFPFPLLLLCLSGVLLEGQLAICVLDYLFIST